MLHPTGTCDGIARYTALLAPRLVSYGVRVQRRGVAVDVTSTMEAVELAAGALGNFVARLGFATVWRLRLDERPQPVVSPVALLNVSGWCEFHVPPPAGLCVMAVGRDTDGGILWACSLMAQATDHGPQHLLESLLVPPEVLSKTAQVVLRVSGGRFPEEGPPELSVAPGRAGRGGD